MRFSTNMKRRNFNKNTLLAAAGSILGTTNSIQAFTKILTEQNFDFMSQNHPNLTLIHDFFAAYETNDLEGITQVLADDIKWHIPGEHPLSGTKTGIQQVLEFFKRLGKAAFKAEPIVMGVNDDYVIDCHRNWSNLEGGENLDAMSCLLWKIENKQIKEVHNFPQNQKEVNQFFNEHFKE